MLGFEKCNTHLLYPLTALRKWSHATALPGGGVCSRLKASCLPASPLPEIAPSNSSIAAKELTECSHSQIASRKARAVPVPSCVGFEPPPPTTRQRAPAAAVPRR